MLGIVRNHNLQAIFTLLCGYFRAIGPFASSDGVLHIPINLRGNGLNNLVDTQLLSLINALYQIQIGLSVSVKATAT